MRLYDSVITDIDEQLSPFTPRVWAYDERGAWPDVGASELVLQRDAAYELGGSGCPAVHFTCVTTEEILTENQVMLYGPDLREVKRDAPYARIAILTTTQLGEDDEAAYKTIRDMEFVKYHVFPKGYMFRISSGDFREQVRVSRSALQKGISFRSVGFDFIRQYLKNPNVLKVKLLFVTDPQAPYQRLRACAKKTADITRTLTHILDGMPTDCGSCHLKPVCDEVEGMRRLHFKQSKTLNIVANRIKSF